MIDTHAHFNSMDLKNLKKEIKRVEKLTYLDKIINVGLNEKTNKEVIEISNNHEKFYAAIGIHPLHDGEIESLKKLYEQSDQSKIVALGETGLDFSTGENFENQEEKMIKTINLANDLKLPIIIHANNTNREVMSIIKQNFPEYGFVFHCFQPDLEVMEQIMEMNGYISVGTPITRKTAKKSLEVIKTIDINHLLIELDCPYMSSNFEIDGKKVFNKIKEILNIPHQELEDILDSNAKRLFKKII